MKEHLGHLSDLRALEEERLREFLAGVAVLSPADMRNQTTETANHNQTPVTDLLRRLRTVRAEWVQKLENLSEADFLRVALHPRLQQKMRLMDWLLFVAEHDDHHLARISQLVEMTLPIPL